MNCKRTFGLNINPIQLSEIQSFIYLYGNPSIPIDLFIDLISLMDAKFMSLQKT